MDILTHTLSGIAAGTVIASFSKHRAKQRFAIVGLSALGGALPDIDAISLWSKFDTTMGKLFGLNHSGNVIYFSKFWYSHHGFFHSILAGLLITLFIGILIFGFRKIFKKNNNENLFASLKSNLLILVGFFTGFFIHLLEDMPTPACVWGGVRIFFPLKQYVGGTGEIWWWNNYDLFLIICAVILINIVILLFVKFIHFDARKLTILILAVGFMLCVIAIKTRNYDFNYTGHTSKYQQYEQKSKEIQRKILGEKLYRKVEWFDNKMKINF